MDLIKNGKTGIRRKGILFSFVFICLMTILILSYTNVTKMQRLDHLKQTVTIVRTVITPTINSLRNGEISRDEAVNQVRDIVRNMIYSDSYGDNYIFMSSYDGIMLVQPFQPEMELENMWDLRDANGKYIIRSLVEAAMSDEKKGFVSYYYMRPNSTRPELKISYVIGIPELQCYIGTGQYMTDIRKNQWLYTSISLVLSLILLILIFLLVRSTLLIYDIHNETVARENDELKALEAALRRSEKNYRDLFEQSPIGLVLYKMNGDMVTINPTYASMIGYSVDEALKLSYWDLTPRRYVDQEKQMLRNLKVNGKYGPYNKEYIHKNGEFVPVRLNGTLVERDGEYYVWSGIEDISTYKQMEKEKNNLENQLRQVYKMEAVGTLAGGIAHDFNNLLFPILGYAEQLKTEVEKGSPIYSGLEVIFNSAVRARDLVKQILTFSRQEDSVENIFKIQPEIKKTLELLRSTIPSTIEIQHSIDSACRSIKGDPTQLNQIIMNLAANGCHAMEAHGGVLKIKLREMAAVGLDFANQEIHSNAYALLSIEDQGTGIDESIMDKIFDPFFTTKETGRGTGLGLSVVHGIIKSMDGFIKVNSNMGAGTEFRVFFPIKESLEEIEVNDPGRNDRTIRNERILLVDDEDNVLKVEELMLSNLGYRITASANGKEALDIFIRSPDSFDLVITDMTMPIMTGDKLITELRKIRPELPVILCSGYNETAMETIQENHGATEYIHKPILTEDMIKTIDKVLLNKVSSERSE